jgi:hypothetical protein
MLKSGQMKMNWRGTRAISQKNGENANIKCIMRTWTPGQVQKYLYLVGHPSLEFQAKMTNNGNRGRMQSGLHAVVRWRANGRTVGALGAVFRVGGWLGVSSEGVGKLVCSWGQPAEQERAKKVTGSKICVKTVVLGVAGSKRTRMEGGCQGVHWRSSQQSCEIIGWLRSEMMR